VSVIYNSSAFPVVAEPKSLSINLRILAVIPLSKRKGSLDLAHFVVEFDRKYKELNFVVDVVGCLDDTRLYTELRKVVSMEGCEHRLRFHGTMSHDELGELYRKADVLLHPSHTEAFPRVLVEAMNHGLPCVATNVGGSGEAVVHGITGFLVPVGNIDEMTRSVMKILTNQSLHEKMSKASLKRYQKLFVRKSMVEQVLRIVSSVATRVNIKGL
jgi:glycosyltransferase involved in cell wall biosynthesis